MKSIILATLEYPMQKGGIATYLANVVACFPKGAVHVLAPEDPESHDAVVLRPREWAGAYEQAVGDAVKQWRAACRRHGIFYHRALTDTPFGDVLREALALPRRAA